MALEERFFPTSELESLSVHMFAGVMWDYVLDNKTRAQALDALNAYLEEGPLSVAEQDDLTTIADAIDAAGTVSDQLFKVLDYEMALRQTSNGVDYLTLADLRARMGL